MAAVDSLKILAIAGRTDSAGVAQPDQDQEETRLPTGILLGQGFTPNLLDQSVNPNAWRVRQNTGTDMNVLVGSGTTKRDGYVLRGTVAGQGSYIVRLDATTKSVSVPATDATNPARYGVYLWVNDAAYSGTASRAYAGISCLRGTPAGSPVTPTASAVWSAWALLWEFQLPANATAVTNTILDSGTSIDQRVRATSQIGPRGVVGYATQAGSQATISAVTDLTSMLVAWTVPTGGGRLYKLTVHVYGQQNTSTGEVVVTVVTGTSGAGSALTPWPFAIRNANLIAGQTANLSGSTYFTASAGAASVHARLQDSVGSFTTFPANGGSALIVEDIGPA
jgi:hypothetical protein